MRSVLVDVHALGFRWHEGTVFVAVPCCVCFGILLVELVCGCFLQVGDDWLM